MFEHCSNGLEPVFSKSEFCHSLYIILILIKIRTTVYQHWSYLNFLPAISSSRSDNVSNAVRPSWAKAAFDFHEVFIWTLLPHLLLSTNQMSSFSICHILRKEEEHVDLMSSSRSDSVSTVVCLSMRPSEATVCLLPVHA